jgi:hypothetical protein
MRGSLLWRGGVLSAAAALACLLAVGSARAQPGPVTYTLMVTENREPGLAGTVTITPLANNMARVDIRITGFPPNDQERPAHIHTAPGARCDTGAPVTYPLTNVRVDAQGVGTSTTTITITPDKPIQANNAYVNIHNPAQGGRGVICANITTNITGLTAAAAQATPQRPTGPVATPAAQRPAPAAAPRTGTGVAGTSAAGWLLAVTAAALLGVPLAAGLTRRRARR